MAEPRRPWWEVATPQQRRGLEAANWRREMDATIFHEEFDPTPDETLPQSLKRRGRESRQNPLGPAPKEPEPTIRGGTVRERMLRAFDRERTAPLTDEEFAEVTQGIPEFERRLREPETAPPPPREPIPLPETVRGGSPRERMVRAFGRDIAPRQRDELTAADIETFVADSRARGLSDESIETSFRHIAESELGRDSAAMLVGEVFKVLDRPRGALAGAVAGAVEEGPGGILPGAARGFREPEQFRGIEFPGIRDLPDVGISAGPLNLTPRTVAGFGAEVLTDPLILAGAGGRRLIGAPVRAAAERATRIAAQPQGVQKLLRLLEEAVPVRGRTEVLRRKELQQRAAQVGRITEAGGGESAFRQARAAQAGELPIAAFEPVAAVAAREAATPQVVAGVVAARASEEASFRQVVENFALIEVRKLETRRQALVKQWERLTQPERLTQEGNELALRIDRFDEAIDNIAADPFQFAETRGFFKSVQTELFPDRPPISPSEFLLGGFKRFHPDPVEAAGSVTFRSLVGQADIDSMIDDIGRNPSLRPFERTNTQAALIDVLNGKLPTRGQIGMLEKVFGPDFAAALQTNRGLGRKAWETFLDASGIPRSILSSFDISFPFRQGALAITRKEWWQAWAPMIKAFGRERFAQDMDDLIKAGPKTRAAAEAGDETAQIAVRNAERNIADGVDFTALDGAGQLTDFEEGFMSRIANKIPGIRQSQRAFTTFGNVYRRSTANNFAAKVDDAVSRGVFTSDDALAQRGEMAEWLNISTGRANISIGEGRSLLLTIANRIFFSPRLLISRLQAIGRARKIPGGAVDIARGIPSARAETARDIVGFIATGTASLAAMDGFGWIDVKLDDLTSSDWAKGKAGTTRYDPWGGFQQVARFVSQIVAGAKEAIDSGDLSQSNIAATIGRFTRSKLDPGVPALFVDLALGSTFLGEELSPEQQLSDRFMPLSIQDILDAAAEEGLLGAVKSLPAFTGIGVQAFETINDARNKVAFEMFPELGVPFKELNVGQRRQVDESERVKRKIGEREPDPGSPQQQATAAFLGFESFNADAETGLRAKIDAGLDPKALRAAIRDFRGDRFTASDALFTDVVEGQIDREDQPIEDVFAERYWSTELPEDPETFRFDFDARDAAREEILAQATAQGVDANYITGTGRGTYRGQRFRDPVVVRAIEEHEAVEQSLKDAGLFDIQKDEFAKLKADERRPQMRAELAEFDTFLEYRDALIDGRTAALVERGFAPEVARPRAERDIQSFSVVQRLSEKVQQARADWVRANQALAVVAIERGYLSPSLLNIARAGEEARPGQ